MDFWDCCRAVGSGWRGVGFSGDLGLAAPVGVSGRGAPMGLRRTSWPENLRHTLTDHLVFDQPSGTVTQMVKDRLVAVGQAIDQFGSLNEVIVDLFAEFFVFLLELTHRCAGRNRPCEWPARILRHPPECQSPALQQSTIYQPHAISCSNSNPIIPTR